MEEVMKKLILCILALAACNKPYQECRNTTNDNFQVELLFEVDGIRMYRFKDRFEYKYFASRGTVIGEYKRTAFVGKSHHYRTYGDDIQTVDENE
jgi:hypothetical protein